LNRALPLNPKLAEALNHRGVVWFVKGNFKRAVADFEQALKLKPRLAEAYGNRGLVWLLLGWPQEAEADFTRCRELGGTLKPDAEKLLREMKGGIDRVR